MPIPVQFDLIYINPNEGANIHNLALAETTLTRGDEVGKTAHFRILSLYLKIHRNMYFGSNRLTHAIMTITYQQLTPLYARGVIIRSFARAQCLNML